MASCPAVVCFIVVAFTAPVAGVRWTSPTDLENITVTACEGDTIPLVWTFATDPGEHVMDVEWYFHAPGVSDEIIATFVAGNFFKTPSSRQKLEFLPNAGIRLLNVSQSDFGTYSVHVNTELHGITTKHVQEAFLTKPDAPVTSDGHLHAQLLFGAVQDTPTGEWHVQLACGHFFHTGNPPVSVIWTTPLGGQINSTSFTDGQFLLNLPIPVTPGDYSCQLNLPSVTRTCGGVSSPLLDQATVKVDAFDVVMMARLQAVEQDNARLHQDNDRLRQELQATSTIQDAVHKPQNCQDVAQYSTASGVHDLCLPDNITVRVYCDQQTDGGGWTVLQRRKNGLVNFNRTWVWYEDGFGYLEGEFWLGLTNIYSLTSSANYVLRVDLADWDDNTVYALYDTFYIDGPILNYTLHVSGYSGTAGDSLDWHNNQSFSTPDRDNNIDDRNCGMEASSGWWFESCAEGDLNGPYSTAKDTNAWFAWLTWHNDWKALKRSEMKIRPRN